MNRYAASTMLSFQFNRRAIRQLVFDAAGEQRRAA